MKIKNISFLVLVFCTFTFCKTYEGNSQSNKDLVGEWNWISTDGGIGFHIHKTPESTGKEIILKLNDDFTYSFTENGKIISKGTYTISLKKSISDQSEKRFISFSNDSGKLVESVDSMKLQLSDNVHDGLGSVYERIK